MKESKLSVAVSKLMVCFFFGFITLIGMMGNQARATETVIAFGDSITAGWPYKMDDGDGCYYCGGYEIFLQDFLDYAGRDAAVYNYGVPGEYTGQALNRIDGVMASTNPDYVLLMEGTNDLAFYVDPQSVVYNLYWMSWKVIMWGAKPILATITPDTRNGLDWKGIGAANDWIRYYVSNDPLICLSDQDLAIKDYWDYGYNYDGLHPNWWGYWIMAATWYDDLLTLKECGY